jgi:cytochrome c oxidase cbb3-type subunit IV
MKIVTKTLEGIADIQFFPIIGLVIFFIMFVALLFFVSRLTKNQIDEFSNLPLDNKSDLSNEKIDSLN